MGVTKFNQVQADQFLGSQADASPFGKIWYVDVTNGSDGNLGDGPNAGESFASIGAAITAAVATRGDTVVIAPGTYTITSALAPKAFMTFRAAVVNPQAPSVSIRGNLATLMNVDVNGCRFIGLEFRPTGTTNADLVRLADTTAITGGVTFEDCVFNGNDQANATLNGVAGLPYAKIEDNVFAIDTNLGWGISLEDTAAFGTGKGFIIRNNEFIGPDSTTTSQVGIRIVGTEDATAAGMIRTNYFAYCTAAAITADKISDSMIENYVGNDAGGVLVDSGT